MKPKYLQDVAFQPFYFSLFATFGYNLHNNRFTSLFLLSLLSVTWIALVVQAIKQINQADLDNRLKRIYYFRGMDVQLFFIVISSLFFLKISSLYVLVPVVMILMSIRWYDLFKLDHYFNHESARCLMVYQHHRWLGMSFYLLLMVLFLINTLILR